jgi:hypothetical protein
MADWIPAVPLSWSTRLFRPVTLRRHLSVGLPLSETAHMVASCRRKPV